MDTKKFLTGTVVGGITNFILGFIFYAVLFGDFFANNGGGATGVDKTENMVWWSLILGNFAIGALLSYIFIKWAHISTFNSGLRAGAVIGFLMALGFDLIMFGTSYFLNFTATIVDIAIATVMTALVGGAIGAVLHAKPQEEVAAA